mgnify:CR=1 FL=1
MPVKIFRGYHQNFSGRYHRRSRQVQRLALPPSRPFGRNLLREPQHTNFRMHNFTWDQIFFTSAPVLKKIFALVLATFTSNHFTSLPHRFTSNHFTSKAQTWDGC